MGNTGRLYQSRQLIIFIALAVILGACRQDVSYATLVSRELARDAQADSLWLGLRFNMTMEEFFIYCFNQNQKGEFFQNSGSSEVIYTFKGEFKAPVDYVFFPAGGNASIQQLEGTMVYQSWAPFTKEFTAEHLQEEVIRYLEAQYGGRPFLAIDHPEGFWPQAFVKVDANRKILLYRSFDDRKLHVVFENLRSKS